MSTFLVYRASAGSGKTFMLVRQYLLQVFKNPQDYRRILAVTFTNKAADEMKSRLLHELDVLDRSPQESSHLEFLKDHFKQTDAWLQQTARSIKSSMLHDFTRISVGTIDSFFQQVLRSFARESGLSSTFQLELDTDFVLEKFSRQIFNEAKGNIVLMTWLTDWVKERMENSETWHKLEADLVRLGHELLKEDILASMVSDQSAVPSPDDINNLKKDCRDIIKAFNDEKIRISTETKLILEKYHLEVADFNYGSAGPVGFLLKFGESKDGPKIRARESVDQEEKWVGKKVAAERRKFIFQNLYPTLNELMKKAIRLFDENIVILNSAKAVNRNLYALGFSAFLFDYFKTYFNDNNQLLLSLAQPLVNQIIGDNPSPFIYEKTGTYYNHFLIDEFQDTSDLQWKNFRPLLVDSLSAGGLGMVVGDIKQSLYRWRNSNWRLLHKTAVDDLSAFGTDFVTLDKNQRSVKSVIDFNNRVFSELPDIVADHLNVPNDTDTTATDTHAEIIREVFLGSEQQEGQKANLDGRVEIRFFDKGNEEKDWRSEIAENLPAIVKGLIEKNGYRQEDITFLVRKNSDADKITSILSDWNHDWTFVSSDVFRIGNSPVIKMILNAMRFLADPKQTLYRDLFLWDVQVRSTDGNPPTPGFQEESLERFQEFAETVSSIDLLSITDKLIKDYGLDSREDELAYIYQFRDQVNSCMVKGISHPDGFLNWWDTSGHKQMLVSESLGSAMRIMTIHKAKGLSSPVIIIPYCNWDFNHNSIRAPWLWVKSDREPFNRVRMIPVKYDSLLQQSLFSESYNRERIDAYLDNLNLLYVAFTRAVEVLIVFCPFGNNMKTVADALQICLKGDLDENMVYRRGNPDFKNPREQLPDVPVIQWNTPMVAGSMKETVTHRTETEYEGTRYGKNVHQVLETVMSADDLPVSISQAVGSGIFTADEAEAVQQGIMRLFNIPEVRDWFYGTWEIWNEAAILVPRYGEKRPDRVMLRDGKVVIVDYKTGVQESKHHSQVASYMKLLADMGYPDVRGYLLYIDAEKLIEVKSREDFFQPGLFDPEV